MNLRDLKLRIDALLASRRVERELDDELAFHIERETQKLVDSGVAPAAARTRALARFGSVPLTADRCRDTRGTAFVENAVRDVLYACRSFRRAPLTALTIVATVAVGLGLVAVVFTFFNALFFRVDAVRAPEQLFTIERLPRAGARVWIPFTRPDYEALRRDPRLFTDVVGVLRGIGARINGQPANGTLVTGNFFQALGVTAALGRTLIPPDDQRGGRGVLVLSHRGWITRFAGDPAVIGRSVLVNGVPCEIAGVMPDGFRGLALAAPDYWAPLALAGQVRPAAAGKEDEIPIVVIGRLKPGVSPHTAAAGLGVWASERGAAGTGVDGPAYFRLRPSQGTVGDDAPEALMVFSPLFFAFGLTLLIGCANVANLLLARGVARQAEIGIRLSLGASRRRVVRQLLTESVLLALAAAACALAVSRVLLETLVRVAMATMPPEMAEQVNLGVPPADWRVVGFLLCAALLSTVCFGLAPALHATRLELVRTMRGEITRNSRPGWFRNVLITAQVTASALLLICAAVFLRSAFAASTSSAGVRTADTIMVNIDNESRRAATLDALARHPAVADIAASMPHALSIPRTAFAEATQTAARAGVGYRFVSPGYFAVLDIAVRRGRSFTETERTAEAGVVVVSESTARRLWPDRDAVGQTMLLERPASGSRQLTPGSPSVRGSSGAPFTLTVIGVVRDVTNRLHADDSTDAVVYLPTNRETAGTALTLRVRGDPTVARQALVDHLSRVDPALGTIMTMRTMAGLGAYLLRLAFWVTVVLGGLALVLTVSGLFSVLSYVVEQRAQEIGVRMALGATGRDVAGIVLSQSLRPVGLGLVGGATLAGTVATALLATPAAAQIGDVVQVFDPVAYAASLLVILTACLLATLVPAVRATRIDPIATLRRD